MSEYKTVDLTKDDLDNFADYLCEVFGLAEGDATFSKLKKCYEKGEKVSARFQEDKNEDSFQDWLACVYGHLNQKGKKSISTKSTYFIEMKECWFNGMKALDYANIMIEKYGANLFLM